jgi:hypothetical protein
VEDNKLKNETHSNSRDTDPHTDTVKVTENKMLCFNIANGPEQLYSLQEKVPQDTSKNDPIRLYQRSPNCGVHTLGGGAVGPLGGCKLLIQGTYYFE